MIYEVSVPAFREALPLMGRRIDGQSTIKLRYLLEKEQKFPGSVENAAFCGVLSDATFTPGLMLHVTREPHSPATQGMDAYGPYADAAAARREQAEHFRCEPANVVITFEAAHGFLGAYVPEAPASTLTPGSRT